MRTPSTRGSGHIAAALSVLAALGCTPADPPGASDAGAARNATATATATATPTATATGTTTATATATAGPSGKVVCFGDSITQAEWAGKIAPEERWVTQLGKKSDRIVAVNAGKNGRTTGMGLTELPPVLDQHRDAAYVLFFLGVNDMKHATVGVVEKATANLGKMVDMTREKLPKAEVVILAPINVSAERFTPFFKEEMSADVVPFMKALAVAYRSLAEKKRARFVNLLDAVPPAEIEDGVHANGKGQIKIADAVWKGLNSP